MIESETTSRTGCLGCSLGCVGAVVGVPVVLGLIIYLVIFHSSLPLKWVAGELTKDVGAVQFDGVGGSLSSGITIKEITIKRGKTENSTIEGFEFRYTGLLDSIRNRQLVIEKLSIERSDIIVDSGFFDDDSSEEEEEEAPETDDETEVSVDEDGDQESGRFELRELNFQNTRFRTSDGEVDVEIPLFRLAGLKIEGDEFHLAELEVVSDVLVLELLDAAPAEIEGQLMPFTRKVQGKMLPEIHPMVKSEIDFSVEFAAVDGGTRSRIIACGGAIEQTSLLDGKSLVRFKALTLGDYFEAENHVFPERFTTTAREAEDVVEFESGEFYLGETRFEIAPQRIETEDPESAIEGKAEVAGHAIIARIRPDKEERLWPPLTMELVSEPNLDLPELLALVYFQRAFAELAAEEKARVDGMAKALSGAKSSE